MLRIFITSGIYYPAFANTLKAVQYVVIYGMSEMRCYNPEYLIQGFICERCSYKWF